MIKNLSEIKAKSDIVEILSHFLHLQKAGANYQALCPFHNEKSPSFIISQSNQIFKCFGCDKSGDIFSFMQSYKNLSFNEAVERVAELSGVNVEYSKDSMQTQNKDIYKNYEDFFKKAREKLNEQPQLIKYLNNRGLNNDDLDYFHIGFMPQKHEILEIFTAQTALALGLLKKHSTGETYVPFKERIIFAIRNNAFKIVGLSGRTHPYSNFKTAPKYLNSPASFLFKKSEHLYLLPYAKSTIKESGKVIIVEGYMDAIALYKLGYKNAVATCGTAFNDTHIAQIARLNNDIKFILCFDNDSAGINATIKAINLLFLYKFYDSEILILKNVKDTGEILEKGLNPNDYFTYIPALKYLIHYHFKHAKTHKDKDKLLAQLHKLIDSEENYFSRSFLIDNIAEYTHIPKDYFYTKKLNTPAVHTIKDGRALKLCWAIYNNDDFAFLAKYYLDIATLPKHLQTDINHFLHTQKLTESAQKIALNPNLQTHFTQDTFYREILHFHLQDAKDKLLSARLSKDIEKILYFNHYIKQTQEQITQSYKEVDIF